MELGKPLLVHEEGWCIHSPFFSFFVRCPAQSETFSPPNQQQVAKGAEYIASYHGFAGPVQATYPDLMYGGPQQPAFIKTIQALTGIARYKDLNGGTPNCVSVTPLSIDWHRQDHRSSSAEAYLTPVESQRTGWTTLTDHIVCSILSSFNWMLQPKL
jgi:choline dehydrogenase